MEGYCATHKIGIWQGSELLVRHASRTSLGGTWKLNHEWPGMQPPKRTASARVPPVAHLSSRPLVPTCRAGSAPSSKARRSNAEQWPESSEKGFKDCKVLSREDAWDRTPKGDCKEVSAVDSAKKLSTSWDPGWHGNQPEGGFGGWSFPIQLDNTRQSVVTTGFLKVSATVLLAVAMAVHGYRARSLPRGALEVQPWASLTTASSFEMPSGEGRVRGSPEMGRVVVPSVVDPSHERAGDALRALQVIEEDVDPAGICTRREFARWLVSASSTLSRTWADRVFPAMYIEGITELAFDDVPPDDRDFPSIQGLAEAGLIPSRLSRSDLGCHRSALKRGCSPASGNLFNPNSPLSRQDLISWKVMMEQRHLPPATPEAVKELSGFIDVERIDRDCLPAIARDLKEGSRSLISAAFGCTRRFEPGKPVTHAQAACTLALGNAAEAVAEELERLDAEGLEDEAAQEAGEEEAEGQSQADVAAMASRDEEVLDERGMRLAAEDAAEVALREVEQARIARWQEEEAVAQAKARAEAERELLVSIRRQAEEQLAALACTQQEIEGEKARLAELCSQAAAEKLASEEARREVEVERKALTMARTWVEEEASKTREEMKQLKVLRRRAKVQQEANNASPTKEATRTTAKKHGAFAQTKAEKGDAARNGAVSGVRSSLRQAVEKTNGALTEAGTSVSRKVKDMSESFSTSASLAAAACSDGARKCKLAVEEAVTRGTKWLSFPANAQ